MSRMLAREGDTIAAIATGKGGGIGAPAARQQASSRSIP